MKINAKYGFGMAPISANMQGRYDYAVQTLRDILHSAVPLAEIDCESLSECKGMFNRCLRQDQWDWFAVHQKLGRPRPAEMQFAAQTLTDLRRAVLFGDEAQVEQLKNQLRRMGIERTFETFLHEINDFIDGEKTGWLYILSTREQPTLLKIGMTTRSVVARVREINTATGVLVPFSARAIFRVLDAAQAEKAVFAAFAAYRIRSDREFFEMPFGKAASEVEEVLRQNRLNQENLIHTP